MTRPNVVLLWGEDPFLLREEALGLIGDAQASEIEAPEWEGGETSDLVTPSLFGETRALLVNDCRSLPDAAIGELKSYLEDPSPDAVLILSAQVPERGKAPASLVKLIGGTGEVRDVRVARKDLPGWVLERAARKELAIAPDAARELVATIGDDPAALDQALDQLAAAFIGQRVTGELVASQFRGLGEQRVWDLCDQAFAKNLPKSIRSLRSLLESREDPLMVLGVIAARLRDLIRVKALPERMPQDELARAAGLRFDWQARRYREQARKFTMEELTGLHDRLVDADRLLKSGGSGDVVLPVVVTAVAEA
ncbi:MAG: DNA polymerase III subunit delta [Actinomycetota bacterium]